MNQLQRLLTVMSTVLIMTVGTAVADVNICLGNGTYKCYETDLTCADITIGIFIRACEDLSIAGGGTGSGVVTQLHPDVDGQSFLGPVVYCGSAPSPTGPLSDFVVIWESRDTFEPGRRVQAVGRDASGALYRAEFEVNGLDRRDIGDFVVSGTPTGQEIFGPFDDVPTGQVGGGDMTVTIFVVPANDPSAKTTVLETHYTDIVFSDLAWVFLSSEPVAEETLSWGAMKSNYR